MSSNSTFTDPSNAALTLTVSDVLTDLGGISSSRLRANGSSDSPAGIGDLAQAHAAGSSCELVDGMLVEKAMGYRESLIAMMIGRFLLDFVSKRQLGLVSGPDGFVQLFSGLVRGPDVAFISWQRLPGRQIPTDAYPSIVPELVIEVVSVSNTRAEMARKRREYFQAGVQSVWIFDPLRRSVAAYSSATQCVVLQEEETLSGGDVLPGLSIVLADVFGVLDGLDDVNVPNQS